ncbi:MAG: helix-turn-helix transcriptional regulator [Pseudomonadota bacterium]|nr:helix-turn-helix transcriptional regulator [Pseudomonadota bacterium]
MSFASRLKLLRLHSGQSLQDVADKVGLSKPHVWELETGKSKNPTKDVLEKLSVHFGKSIAYLVGESDDAEDDAKLGVMFRELRALGSRDRDLIETLIQDMRKRHSSES